MITALPEEVSSAEQLKGSPGNSLISSSYHADGWAVTQGFAWGCASCSHYSWTQPGPRWWLRSNTTDFALHCTAVQKCVLMLPGHRMLRRRSWELQSEALRFRCSPFPTTSLGHREWRDWKSQLRAPPTQLCVTKKGVLAVLDEDMALNICDLHSGPLPSVIPTGSAICQLLPKVVYLWQFHNIWVSSPVELAPSALSYCSSVER